MVGTVRYSVIVMAGAIFILAILDIGLAGRLLSYINRVHKSREDLGFQTRYICFGSPPKCNPISVYLGLVPQTLPNTLPKTIWSMSLSMAAAVLAAVAGILHFWTAIGRLRDRPSAQSSLPIFLPASVSFAVALAAIISSSVHKNVCDGLHWTTSSVDTLLYFGYKCPPSFETWQCALVGLIDVTGQNKNHRPELQRNCGTAVR